MNVPNSLNRGHAADCDTVDQEFRSSPGKVSYMGRRSRESILKRSRELKRQRKAAEKRERRLARKQGKNESDDLEDGEDLDGPYPEEPQGADIFRK
jgi:hypothetical protein